MANYKTGSKVVVGLENAPRPRKNMLYSKLGLGCDRKKKLVHLEWRTGGQRRKNAGLLRIKCESVWQKVLLYCKLRSYGACSNNDGSK